VKPRSNSGIGTWNTQEIPGQHGKPRLAVACRDALFALEIGAMPSGVASSTEVTPTTVLGVAILRAVVTGAAPCMGAPTDIVEAHVTGPAEAPIIHRVFVVTAYVGPVEISAFGGSTFLASHGLASQSCDACMKPAVSRRVAFPRRVVSTTKPWPARSCNKARPMHPAGDARLSRAKPSGDVALAKTECVKALHLSHIEGCLSLHTPRLLRANRHHMRVAP
jgi:hypothetical protein